MLTDIFAARYAAVPMWQGFGEAERRLLVQLFKVLNDQLIRYHGVENKEDPMAKIKWKAVHDQLAMELGLDSLSAPGYWATNKQYYLYTVNLVCKGFMCANYDAGVGADRFMKERLSLVELAFRYRENEVKAENARYAEALGRAKALDAQVVRLRSGMTNLQHVELENRLLNDGFNSNVRELNERLRQAGARLNYHNGLIQVSADEQIADQIETPFWTLVKEPKWANVDTDMKEAIDRRDSGGRDPAFYAARALESAIKIISGEKGWTRGDEKGAAGYVNNLVSQKNGRFISQWEGDGLKAFFLSVRNDLGHGPGGEPMPELSPQQTDWAIEFCMSWIKSLFKRM